LVAMPSLHSGCIKKLVHIDAVYCRCPQELLPISPISTKNI
jgi:hypothetical protein